MLAGAVGFAIFKRIGGVEGDPEEDVTADWVFLQLGTLQPAQGAVNAQAQTLGEMVTVFALVLFARGEVQIHERRRILIIVLVRHSDLLGIGVVKF